MTKEETAYLAGIIDGEGCLGVTSNKASGSLFIPYLAIGNTSKELIDYIHVVTGEGSICTKKGKKDYYKDNFVLTIRSGGLRKLLPQVVGYLVVKKKQAELLLELLPLLVQPTKSYSRTDPERFEHCSSIASALFSLNKRSKPGGI